MKKVLLWFVSNDGRFLNAAMQILERQQNGLDVVGVTAGVPIQFQVNGKNVPFIPLDKIDGGGMIFYLLSAQNKSA